MTRDERVAALMKFIGHRRVTIPQMIDGLGWRRSKIQTAIHETRILLAEDIPTVTLDCDFMPYGGYGKYHLTGVWSEGAPWVFNRLGDTHTRLRTQLAVMSVLANGVDKRTIEGKHVKIISFGLTQALDSIQLAVDLLPEEK